MQLCLGHWGAWLRGPLDPPLWWGHILGIHQGHFSTWEENWGHGQGTGGSCPPASPHPLEPPMSNGKDRYIKECWLKLILFKLGTKFQWHTYIFGYRHSTAWCFALLLNPENVSRPISVGILLLSLDIGYVTSTTSYKPPSLIPN